MRQERLQRVLAREHSRGRLHGAAGVMWSEKSGKPQRFAQAFGFSFAGTDNTPDTRFPIGSLTKLLTAATVLRLWQDGQVALDVPIAEVLQASELEWGPGADRTCLWACRITLHHLLSHTAGLPDLQLGAQEIPPQDLLRRIVSLPALQEPGSHVAYGNTAYILAALALQSRLGKPFDQLVREQVCLPLGLHHTHAMQSLAQHTPVAVGTLGDKPALAIPASWLIGAGDWVSTVDDLLRFQHALVHEEWLGADARDRMLGLRSSGPGAFGNGTITGYGWRTRGDLAWHDGLLPGVVTTLHRRIDGDAAAVILCNRLPSAGHARAAAHNLRALAATLLSCIATSDAHDVQDGVEPNPAGTFQIDNGCRVAIAADQDGALTLHTSRQQLFTLIGLLQALDVVGQNVRQRAEAFVRALGQGSQDALAGLCASLLPDPAALCELWVHVTTSLGPLLQVQAVQHEGQKLVVCRCIFERQSVDVHLHFDADAAVIGFYLHEVGTAPACTRFALLQDGPGCFRTDGYALAAVDVLVQCRSEAGQVVELILRSDKHGASPVRAIRVK